MNKMNKMNKINIILDLDECCIHSLEISKDNYNNFNEYRDNIIKKGYNVAKFIIKISKNEDIYFLTFIRPHLKEFIRYLFKNYNISVWSNGDYRYVKKICNIIFTNQQKKKLNYIFAKKNIKKFKVIPRNIVRDINNKKTLYDLTSKKGVKVLSYLFKNKPYSILFKKENTILIDNLKEHLDFNKTNMIHIRDWFFFEKNDTILLDIIQYLEKNKNYIDISKLKHFRLINKKTKKKLKKNTKTKKLLIIK